MLESPSFIDNRDGNTFATAIGGHLKALREAGESPEELCIATGYFNAAGWLRVAYEAEKLGKVRLLIGAEPRPSTEMAPRKPGDPREPERTKKQVQEALSSQVRGLKTERDQAFDFHPDGLGRLKRLLEFFRSERVEVRRYQERFFHAKAWLLRGSNRSVLAGSSNLTAAGMAGNLELNLGHIDDPLLEQVEIWYDEVWEEASPFDLAELYEVLFEEFSPWLIYLRVLWELYGDEVEEEPQEDGHLSLTRFQKHGIWRAQRVLKDLGGVVIADGVGLGKTFVAGGLMESYKARRQRILLIRPAALKGTWDNFLSANFLGDVEPVSYEKLAGDIQFGGKHGHLNRPADEYQLVVIDEAHNYRNPDAPTRAGVLRQLLRGPRRDLVLLTATPVNNSLYDLYHLVSFFLKQDSRLLKKGIPSIKALFDEANSVDPGDLHPDLLYPLVDATTVKRTRQFIKKHYQNDRIPGPDGEFVPITFPKPVPKTVRYNLDGVLPGFFAQFAEALMPEDGEPRLTMARYQVERYLLEPDEDAGRENALVGLLRSGLLKRFESSAHAFGNTCRKMATQHRVLLEAMDAGQVVRKDFYKECGGAEDLDEDEFQELLEQSQHSESLNLYDANRLREDVESDLALLVEFAEQAEKIRPDDDPKLRALVNELASLAAQARDDSTSDEEEANNRKVLVFSYFRDTAIWIRDWLQRVIQEDARLACFRGRIATTCGSPDDVGVLSADLAAWGFAPRTAAPDNYTQGDLFDLLISTDVLAEGVNLQQSRNIINYDLPWNPMRLVQRHGRIDRLLSNHKRIYLRTFFPDEVLDALLNLEDRVRSKLALAAASVGVAEAPIEGSAVRDQSFAETREEIERIQSEETDIFEKGGTDSAAQTGEEYRQELRKALDNADLRNAIVELPWKAGSGMARGERSGHFFCAKVGDQVFLRFVPDGVTEQGDLVEEIGTCLRLIECVEETERVLPNSTLEGAYAAWGLARENILAHWDFYTDPANLQPKVRKLNREVDDFLMENPPQDVDQKKLDRVSDTLTSPWPMREENKLRQVWNDEHPSTQAKAQALIKAVEDTGIEPFEQPERFPKIGSDEVRLVCWLAIQVAEQ
jgi:Helicase conserved C-terminal domain/PLD-like domain/SNF2-related domain